MGEVPELVRDPVIRQMAAELAESGMHIKCLLRSDDQMPTLNFLYAATSEYVDRDGTVPLRRMDPRPALAVAWLVLHPDELAGEVTADAQS